MEIEDLSPWWFGFETQGDMSTRIGVWKELIRETFGDDVDYDEDDNSGARRFEKVFLRDQFERANRIAGPTL